MKMNYKFALTVLVSLLLGAAGSRAIHAQQSKTHPVYVISEVDAITDPIALKEYAPKAGDTLAPFNGHFVARAGKAESLEGESPEGIVVIAFDSVEQAHAWYDSPAYQAIKPIRQGATKGRMFIVPRVAPQ